MTLEQEVLELRKYKQRIEAVERALKTNATEATMLSGAAGIIISCAYAANAQATSITQEGVTYNGQELGDWRITVERIK